MKRKTLESLFVLAVFAIAFTVVAKGASLTGQAIYLPDFSSPPAVHENAVTVAITSPMNIEIPGLEEGSTVYVKDGESKYSIRVQHLVQDYSHGDEYLSLLVSPGEKLLRLDEQGSALVDFNNDGKDDALLYARNIAHGQATLALSSP